MTYDLLHVLVDEDGNPATDETGGIADFKKVLRKALLTDTMSNGDSKFERFELYLKLKLAGATVDITADEAKLIKDASSVYPTLIAGQISYWADGKTL